MIDKREKRAVAPADDAALIAAIASGDLEALGALFERHEPAVTRYLTRLGLARGDVDDLVQATFLEVVRASQRFDPHHAARSWLLGVATIMVRRHRRSLARAAARAAAWAGVLRVRAKTQPSPADLLERDGELRAFVAALDGLSAKKREVFVLVTLEGLSGQQVAEVLGIPVNTVWTRLHHARRDLRAALEEHKPERVEPAQPLAPARRAEPEQER